MIGPKAPHRPSCQVLLWSQMLKQRKYVVVMLGRYPKPSWLSFLLPSLSFAKQMLGWKDQRTFYFFCTWESLDCLPLLSSQQLNKVSTWSLLLKALQWIVFTLWASFSLEAKWRIGMVIIILSDTLLCNLLFKMDLTWCCLLTPTTNSIN